MSGDLVGAGGSCEEVDGGDGSGDDGGGANTHADPDPGGDLLGWFGGRRASDKYASAWTGAWLGFGFEGDLDGFARPSWQGDLHLFGLVAGCLDPQGGLCLCKGNRLCDNHPACGVTGLG